MLSSVVSLRFSVSRNNTFPFYLGNSKDQQLEYGLYKLVSPSLSPDLVPWITLKKISERSKTGDSVDILKSLTQRSYKSQGFSNSEWEHDWTKDSKQLSVSYLEELMKRDNPVISSGDEVPYLELESGNKLQRSLIVNLRDELRWNFYKFVPGSVIDVLWSDSTFALFEIVQEGEDVISLKGLGLYRTDDPERAKSIHQDPSKLIRPGFTDKVWTGKYKASELNRAIKKFEWESFDVGKKKKPKKEA